MNGTIYRRKASVHLISGPDTCFAIDVCNGAVWSLPPGVHDRLLVAANSKHVLSNKHAGVDAALLLDECVRRYAEAGLVEPVSSGQHYLPESEWNLHDLLMHIQTRGPITEPHTTPKELLANDRCQETLERINAELPASAPEISLNNALQERRSQYSAVAPTLEQIKRLLNLSMQVRWTNNDPTWQRVESRPYPSAGGLHPITVYAVTPGGSGLGAGIYSYHPDDASFSLASSDEAAVHRLLQTASSKVPITNNRVGSLLVLTARYQKTARKYKAHAYRFILLEAGALLQTISLNASGCGLAVSAIGSCDPPAFAHAIGSNATEEPSVLEIVVGQR